MGSDVRPLMLTTARLRGVKSRAASWTCTPLRAAAASGAAVTSSGSAAAEAPPRLGLLGACSMPPVRGSGPPGVETGPERGHLGPPRNRQGQPRIRRWVGRACARARPANIENEVSTSNSNLEFEVENEK